MSIAFDTSYLSLPEHFYARLPPTPVARPDMIRWNRELAEVLGIDPGWMDSPEAVRALAGNSVLPGSLPIAMAYAGHQFGGFNPQLGDGRAILLGEVVAPDARRFDIQLKGSGPTPYSRGGDGRSPLGPVLREYIVSEAMHALGVPSTRSLAAVATGQRVFRDRPLPGAVLTRVAASHIRVGTFEFFAARQDRDGLRALLDYVIERHYPELGEHPKPALALLEQVIERQAALIARWQLLGFIHGVMNTDNTLISGETIDYGPCAFMDDFDPATVFSSIDRNGRYAYGNQPRISAWNMMSLAQALIPIMADREREGASAQELLDGYEERFHEHYWAGLRAKLGLFEEREIDDELIGDFLATLKETRADFTLSFRRLSDLANPSAPADTQVGSLFEFPEAFSTWLGCWQERIADDGPAEARQRAMYRSNPAFIPRNHLVEEAIEAAQNDQHFCAFHDLVEVVTRPFEFELGKSSFARPPRAEQVVKQTFCGT